MRTVIAVFALIVVGCAGAHQPEADARTSQTEFEPILAGFQPEAPTTLRVAATQPVKRHLRRGVTDKLEGEVTIRQPTTQQAYVTFEPVPSTDPIRIFKITRTGSQIKGVFKTYSLQYAGPARKERDLPVPQAVIESGWMYVNGDAPCVGTHAVIAQAEGCRLILYYYTKTGDPEPNRCRVCYLEGNPGQVVWVYSITAIPESRFLTAGTIGEVIVKADGTFKDWADPVARHFRQPIDELPDTDSYWSTLETVELYRYNNNID